MEDKTKQDLITRLKQAEEFVEKIKAELYAALGKVALLNELLIEQPTKREENK